MKKIIHNRSYDTDTATLIGEHDNGHYVTDFDWECETLYRKRTGEYFLHGQGGARTVYATWRGSESVSSEKIIPYGYDRAREWAERNLTAEEYEKEFGAASEPSVLSITIAPNVRTLIDTEARKSGRTITDVVESCILDVLGE